MEIDKKKFIKRGMEMRDEVHHALKVKAVQSKIEFREALEQAVLNWVNPPQPSEPLPKDLVAMVLSLLDTPRFDDPAPRIRIASRSLNVARELLSDFVVKPSEER